MHFPTARKCIGALNLRGDLTGKREERLMPLSLVKFFPPAPQCAVTSPRAAIGPQGSLSFSPAFLRGTTSLLSPHQ